MSSEQRLAEAALDSLLEAERARAERLLNVLRFVIVAVLIIMELISPLQLRAGEAKPVSDLTMVRQTLGQARPKREY